MTSSACSSRSTPAPWIFDQTTLQFIGERIFNPNTGQVTGERTILQQP